MLDLTKEERTLLSALEKAEAFVYRQAEDFSLIINGFYVCSLNADTCKSLIKQHCLVEVGQSSLTDDTVWLYKADPIVFAPQFQLEE